MTAPNPPAPAGYRPYRRLRAVPDYRRYDALKAIWIVEHPGATPEQYTAAVRAFAKGCKV